MNIYAKILNIKLATESKRNIKSIINMTYPQIVTLVQYSKINQHNTSY